MGKKKLVDTMIRRRNCVYNLLLTLDLEGVGSVSHHPEAIPMCFFQPQISFWAAGTPQ